MSETTQLVLGIAAAALPTITVLVGILLHRNDSNRLEGRISALEVSLRGEISGLRGEIHNDVMLLLGSDKEQDRRITQLKNRA